MEIKHTSVLLRLREYTCFCLWMWALRVDAVQTHNRMLLYTQYDTLHHASVCAIPTVVKNCRGLYVVARSSIIVSQISAVSNQVAVIICYSSLLTQQVLSFEHWLILLSSIYYVSWDINWSNLSEVEDLQGRFRFLSFTILTQLGLIFSFYCIVIISSPKKRVFS